MMHYANFLPRPKTKQLLVLFYYCIGLSSQTQNFELIQVNASNYKSVPSENYLVSNTVLCGTNTVWQHHSSDAVVVGVETSMMVSRALRTQYIYIRTVGS